MQSVAEVEAGVGDKRQSRTKKIIDRSMMARKHVDWDEEVDPIPTAEPLGIYIPSAGVQNRGKRNFPSRASRTF